MTQEERINLCIEEIFRRENHFAEARRNAAIREYEHKVKRATEYLKGEGTIKEREMAADKACEAEMKARFTAEAEAEIASQFLQDARQVLSARQSLLKAEMDRPV